jgi:hypothetical protein
MSATIKARKARTAAINCCFKNSKIFPLKITPPQSRKRATICFYLSPDARCIKEGSKALNPL